MSGKILAKGPIPGEITPRRAARMLGVHQETIYRWCKDAIAGRESRLTGFVRQSVTGRYFIDSAAIVVDKNVLHCQY